jgi:hypothetical protein
MISSSDASSAYRYPPRNLVPDYLRSAIGVGLLIVPTIYSMGAHWLISMILLSLLVLFATFGVTTFIRHFSTILSDVHGLRQQGPRPVSISWAEVRDVELRYFSTRRERAGRDNSGWFQLKVKGPGSQIKVDSNLSDFDELLDEVATAVTRHDLRIGDISRENFIASGHDLPEVHQSAEDPP